MNYSSCIVRSNENICNNNGGAQQIYVAIVEVLKRKER
jgi:hypothetical protein